MPANHSASELPSRTWLGLVWLSVRPRLVHIAADFSIFLVVWLILWLVHVLTAVLPLNSGLGRFIVGFHETVLALSFVWISMVALWDLTRMRGGG